MRRSPNLSPISEHPDRQPARAVDVCTNGELIDDGYQSLPWAWPRRQAAVVRPFATPSSLTALAPFTAGPERPLAEPGATALNAGGRPLPGAVGPLAFLQDGALSGALIARFVSVH